MIFWPPTKIAMQFWLPRKAVEWFRSKIEMVLYQTGRAGFKKITDNRNEREKMFFINKKA